MPHIASAHDISRRRSFQRFTPWLRCLLFGHCDLAPTDAYAEWLPDSNDELELHYCGACGGPVWVRKQASPEPLHWEPRRENDEMAAGAF